MSDRFRRCPMCGRLAFGLERGCCSARCAELERGGYTAPPISAQALRPPGARFDARVIVTGADPADLRAAGTPIGVVARPRDGRTMVRIEAESETLLEEAFEELRAAAGADAVQILTIQQLVPGGLAPAPAMPSPSPELRPHRGELP
jgi:hypothetical protein